MAESLPTVLIPGLLCSPRLYGEQLPALWRFGPVVLADHTRDDSMRGIARRILAVAPRRFTLVGLSMGGYVAFEIMRTSPDRVVRLVLLATSARADTPERTDHRHAQITLARNGRFGEVLDQLFPVWVHRSRRNDEVLRRIVQRMAEETGPEAFIRQQTAIMTRPDSRSDLSAIRCPPLSWLVMATSRHRPTERLKSQTASRPRAFSPYPNVAISPRSSSHSISRGC